ncbi:HAD family hydrolase [Streptomyces sp. NPDC089799]|uniref:HAD family hydrolase n=1 Tax=Streptomyces sp. NPDC089799 TaxID=3155066 RepID=UPI00341564C6
MQIRAVLWDIDDTLFDYTGADTAGLARWLAEQGLDGLHGTPERALRTWREATERHWERFSGGQVSFRGQRRDRVRDFLQRPGLTDEEAEVWFGRYLEHYEAAWALFPDVLPVLDALTDTHRHGLLSNSSAPVQERKMRSLGLWERFEVLVCAAELGVSKPEAEAFLAGCAALGLEPAEVAYVGDNREIDALGARDAGLVAVWLDRRGDGGPAPEGTHRIEGLAELPGVLAGHTRFGARSGIR